MKARQSSRTLLLAASVVAASAFQLPRHHHGSLSAILTPPSCQRVKALEMASGSGGGGGGGGGKNVSKRRRRKRKKADAAAPSSAAEASPAKAAAAPSASGDDEKKQSAKAMAEQLLAQELMMYDEDDLTSFTPQKLEEDDRIAAAAQKAGFSVTGAEASGSVAAGSSESQLEDLFDSREFLSRKREKALADAEREGRPSSAIPTKKKIKRSDVKAYEKLLEMDPLADEDDSYFEDEGIDAVSAWLGDVEPGINEGDDETSNKSGNRARKKTSFLGIGTGPLQVGHTIGALGVVLMAFVEYPGFPLTNLPDPLRGALQGGLGTIYLINTILAVIAAISAPSRNQPSLLWGVKTFAVGGIAYDQLMQIPTPEELEKRAREEEEMTKRRSGRRGGRRQK